jgi:hypothetical protein
VKTISDPAVLEGLIVRLGAVRPDSPRRWGQMTPAEMLCHLGDANTSMLSRPGGAILANRVLRRWIGLYSSLPFPRGVPTLRHVDPTRDGSRPGDFEQDRQRVIDTLRAIAAARPASLPHSHQVFGRMTASDWMRFAYKHTHHHLTQFGV